MNFNHELKNPLASSTNVGGSTFNCFGPTPSGFGTSTAPVATSGPTFNSFGPTPSGFVKSTAPVATSGFGPGGFVRSTTPVATSGSAFNSFGPTPSGFGAPTVPAATRSFGMGQNSNHFGAPVVQGGFKNGQSSNRFGAPTVSLTKAPTVPLVKSGLGTSGFGTSSVFGQPSSVFGTNGLGAPPVQKSGTSGFGNGFGASIVPSAPIESPRIEMPRAVRAETPRLEMPRAVRAETPRLEIPRAVRMEIPGMERPRVVQIEIPAIETPRAVKIEIPSIEAPQIETEIETIFPSNVLWSFIIEAIELQLDQCIKTVCKIIGTAYNNGEFAGLYEKLLELTSIYIMENTSHNFQQANLFTELTGREQDLEEEYKQDSDVLRLSNYIKCVSGEFPHVTGLVNLRRVILLCFERVLNGGRGKVSRDLTKAGTRHTQVHVVKLSGWRVLKGGDFVEVPLPHVELQEGCIAGIHISYELARHGLTILNNQYHPGCKAVVANISKNTVEIHRDVVLCTITVVG